MKSIPHRKCLVENELDLIRNNYIELKKEYDLLSDYKIKYDKYVFQRIWYFFNRQTSPIYRQEAKEKYWILWREVEGAIYDTAQELDFNDVIINKKDDPKAFDQIREKFHAFLSNNHKDIFSSKKFCNLLFYAKILSNQPLKMLNKAEALNMIWRDITWVRSRLLTDNIISDDKLPNHLEYCRIECSKMCSEKDDSLEVMCHETALEIVDTKKTDFNPQNDISTSNKARRTIAFVLLKLNQKRLSDINKQLRIKRAYNAAFLLLVFLSLILLSLNDILMKDFFSSEYIVNYFQAKQKFLANLNFNPLSWIEAIIIFFSYMLHNNHLFFMFFSGLLGGFFSTVMHLRSQDVNLGDVFFPSYLLTKPIVGALGATVLYLILISKIIPIDLNQLTHLENINDNFTMLGPLGFAFGFIMGFSERIILPTVKSNANKN